MELPGTRKRKVSKAMWKRLKKAEILNLKQTLGEANGIKRKNDSEIRNLNFSAKGGFRLNRQAFADAIALGYGQVTVTHNSVHVELLMLQMTLRLAKQIHMNKAWRSEGTNNTED